MSLIVGYRLGQPVKIFGKIDRGSHNQILASAHQDAKTLRGPSLKAMEQQAPDDIAAGRVETLDSADECLAALEAGGEPVLVSGQALYHEPVGADVVPEGARGSWAATAAEQVIDFSGNRCGNDQLTGLPVQQVSHRRMVRVSSVAQRDQRRCIDNECHSPKPASSSSSGTFATDVPSPDQAASRAKLRGGRRDSS